jgi:hypothetical protein
MGGQEGAILDEARLLGTKSGDRGLNLGIAAYRHGDRFDTPVLKDARTLLDELA